MEGLTRVGFSENFLESLASWSAFLECVWVLASWSALVQYLKELKDHRTIGYPPGTSGHDVTDARASVISWPKVPGVSPSQSIALLLRGNTPIPDTKITKSLLVFSVVLSMSLRHSHTPSNIYSMSPSPVHLSTITVNHSSRYVDVNKKAIISSAISSYR